MGLSGTRVGAALATHDVASGVGATASDATGLDDGPGTCVTVSIATAGAGVSIPAAAAASVAAAGAGVPTPFAVSEASVPAPATAGISVVAAGAGFPTPINADVSVAVAGVDIPTFAATADPVAAAEADAISVAITGATVPISAAALSAAAAGAAGSSSALSSRSITSPVGGTPGATPCPVGSAAEAEGGAGVGPYPVPGCGSLPPVAVVEAASAVGSVVSPATPPLAVGGVAACPAEVDDTHSAFFGPNGGTKPRGAVLWNNSNIIKNGLTPGKEQDARGIFTYTPSTRGRRACFASEPDADPRASGSGRLPLPLCSWDTGRRSGVGSIDSQVAPRADP
ncbi:elastin-like [Setaria italica]|uniref:elastin-like n=1 Tax=Setaria italica TaxID=4555 RepID=UPI000350A997|nr:elastin-like [Setaria italica]